MATISVPSNIQVGSSTRVTITLSSAFADDLRVAVTAAPKNSALRAQLDNSGGSVDQKLEKKRASWIWQFTPDKAGVYVISVQEYDSQKEYGGGFQDDPLALPTSVKIGSASSLSINVPQRMVLTLDPGNGLKSDLVVYVSSSSIIKTLNTTYGETTPALITRSLNSRVITAVEDSAVLSALASAVGTSSALVGNLATLSESVRTKWNTHIASATYHATNQDSDNAIDDAFASPGSEQAFVRFVNEALRVIKNHASNDDGGATWDADYHSPGDPRALMVSGVSDYATGVVGLGDIIGFLEEHFQDDTIHDMADGTYPTTSGSVVLTIARAYCDVLRKSAPTAPGTVNQGVIDLAHGVGFEEKEL